MTIREKTTAFLATVLVMLGLSLKIEMGGFTEIFDFFHYDLLLVILTPLLFCFFLHTCNKKKEICTNRFSRFCVIFPSLLFSLFMVIGYSFEKAGSLSLIIGSPSQIFMTILVFLAYAVLLYHCIIWIYSFFEKLPSLKLQFTGRASSVVNKLWLIWEKHPVLLTFCLFILLYLPAMIVSYPAIFWGDTPSQIAQAYNLSEETSNHLNLISEDVKLNNHHPVTHTLLIHFFLVIGDTVLGSFNIGIFLYILFQFAFMLSVMTYTIYYLYRQGIARQWLLLLFCFFSFSPRLQNHMFLVTKDIFYSGFMLLFILTLHRIIIHKLVNKGTGKLPFVLFLSGLGMVLFRNEGIYILTITMLCSILLAKKIRKNALFTLGSIALILFVLQQVIFPLFSITPGSKKEMLSIPFQQTARYVKTYPEEVTPKEKQAIAAILSYDELASLYTPEMCHVKSTFNEQATGQEMKEYFSVWFQMFLKHPQVYFDATLNQVYKFFYPDSDGMEKVPYEDSIKLMNRANELLSEKKKANFHHPEALSLFRTLFEKAAEVFCRLPIISVISDAWFYLWITLLGLFYFLKKQNRTALLLLIPVIFQLFVCFAGPVGGTVYRYLLPIALSLFPVIFLGTDQARPIS
ncbi:MAG: hypothetical protein IJP31_10580 [Lachnospiraceae bacterium]|nr:hypothetical protein [Lachnospiraceae bacterium]